MSVVVKNYCFGTDGLFHEGRHLIEPIGDRAFILKPYYSKESIKAVNLYFKIFFYPLKLTGEDDSFKLEVTDEYSKWSCDDNPSGGWRIEKIVDYRDKHYFYPTTTKKAFYSAYMHKCCMNYTWKEGYWAKEGGAK